MGESLRLGGEAELSLNRLNCVGISRGDRGLPHLLFRWVFFVFPILGIFFLN